MLTRDHLWQFLRLEAFADNIVELHAELELYALLGQFFDRAIYFAILGYAEAEQRTAKSDLTTAKGLVISVATVPEENARSRAFED